jgi:hypothetical protein
MLGTHMSNRREGVARLPGRSWPAGGDDALTLMRLQSDRALAGWAGLRIAIEGSGQGTKDGRGMSG